MLTEVITGNARRVARTIEETARRQNVRAGLIYVASIYNPQVPLAMAILENDGWGTRQDAATNTCLPQTRLRVAQESTCYALASGRSASDQRAYEAAKKRTPASYGNHRDSYEGRSVWLGEDGLIATFVSSTGAAQADEELTREAAQKVKTEPDPDHRYLSESAVLADLLLFRLNELAPGSCGIMMVSLLACDTKNDPILVSVGSTGPLNVGLFSVVMAKVRASIISGLVSGPDAELVRHNASRIEGAVPIWAGSPKDSRVMGVGGLKPTAENSTPDRFLIRGVLSQGATTAVLARSDFFSTFE